MPKPMRGNRAEGAFSNSGADKLRSASARGGRGSSHMVASPGSVLTESILLRSSEPDLGDLEVRRVGKPYTFLKVHVLEGSDFEYIKNRTEALFFYFLRSKFGAYGHF